MPTVQDTIVFVEAIQALPLVALDKCILCGALIPANGCPLCPACDEEEQSLWADYRAGQEQARHPLWLRRNTHGRRTATDHP